MLPRPSGLVTLLTDFPPQDPYVGIMKGALLRASSKVQLLDYAHGLPPHDVEAAAFFAAAAIARFPSGTVHVAVVDPGVGTDRRLLAVAAHDSYWLAPDNGLLSLVVQRDAAAEVRCLDVEHLGMRPESRTFHGRDVLAPIAAWLASGRYGFSALGPRVDDAVTLAADLAPRVVWVDGFGNLITNVDAATIGATRTVTIAGHTVPLCATFGEVPVGQPLGYLGSFGLLEVAVNQGSAALMLGSGRGMPIRLETA